MALIALGAALPCGAAHAAEAGGYVPAGTAENVSGLTWPVAAVAIAHLISKWKPPAIVVRVTVDGDDHTKETPKG